MVRKFLGLPMADKQLLLRSAVLVGLIRMGLWLLPFRMLQSLVARKAVSFQSSADRNKVSIERVGWAVKQASRLVPKATCLTQALAAHVLLGRYGVTARLHIGVATDRDKRFLAHAWLESEGRIVVGASGHTQYTPLLVLKGENS